MFALPGQDKNLAIAKTRFGGKGPEKSESSTL